MPLLSEIEFGSLAVYSPRNTEGRSALSRNVCMAMKQDRFVVLGGENVRIIPRLVRRLREKISGTDLANFFADGPVLVPAPRSSPVKPESLYPTKIICEELLKDGFGSEVRELVHRTHAVRKAATAAPGERPTVKNHYDSLRVERELITSNSILVVDDVVTSGSMLLASVSRLKEVYPRATIRAFGMVRTMSDGVIERLYEPCAGKVTLRGGWCHREP